MLEKLLTQFGQEHLLVDVQNREECLQQLLSFRPEEIALQQTSWQQREKRLTFEPFCDPVTRVEGYPTKRSAAIFLAGGQGSRLGVDGPKGCYPLLGKTLFERHCEKIRRDAPVVILTSRLNHGETLSFFKQKEWFGLQKLSFCCQETLPLFDENGKWFWRAPGQIADGPDGNGSLFLALERSGVLQRLEEEGIETLHIVPIDNPLADPFDPQLAAFHEMSDADLSLKCIYLEDSQEPMGRLVRVEGRLSVVEFAELSEEQRLQNRYANTGLFVMKLSFARLLAKKNFPLHWAWRSSPVWSLGRQGKCFAWKAERFIVDALFYAKRACALACERSSCYAALKEKKSIGEIEKLFVVE